MAYNLMNIIFLVAAIFFSLGISYSTCLASDCGDSPCPPNSQGHGKYQEITIIESNFNSRTISTSQTGTTVPPGNDCDLIGCRPEKGECKKPKPVQINVTRCDYHGQEGFQYQCCPDVDSHNGALKSISMEHISIVLFIMIGLLLEI